MLDAYLVSLAARQDNLAGIWQLAAAGWTESQIRHRTAGCRRVHDGVIRVDHAPMTQAQRWRAPTLMTPESRLSHASAGAHAGFRPRHGGFEVVTRPGRRGRERVGSVLVLWSPWVDERDFILDAGPPRTTVERTIVDLAGTLPAWELRKCVREALRLKLMTTTSLVATVSRHGRRPGLAALRPLADRYARLPFHRCRSDAEAMALELLDRAGRPIPEVNVRVAGEEADQWYPHLGRIIEINGPSFHVLKDEDARKTAVWRAAGLQVDRISSGDVFDHPERYLALAPRVPRRPPGRSLRAGGAA